MAWGRIGLRSYFDIKKLRSVVRSLLRLDAFVDLSVPIYQLDLFDGTIVPQIGDAPSFSRAAALVRPASSSDTSLTSYASGVAAVDTWPWLNSATYGGYYCGTQLTNYCLQSEDFGTTWSAIATGSVTTNDSTSPANTATADKLVGGSAGDGVEQTIGQTIASTGAVFSVFLKASDNSSRQVTIRVENTDDTDGYEKTVTLTDTWDRYVVAGLFGAGVTGNIVVQIIVGDTTGYSVWAWGAMHERNVVGAGAFSDGTARSYIPTTAAAAASANSDLAIPTSAVTQMIEKGTFSFWWFPLWDTTQALSATFPDGGAYRGIFSISPGGAAFRIYFGGAISNAGVVVQYGGTTMGSIDIRTLVAKESWSHFVIAFDNTGATINYKWYIDGAQAVSNTTATPTTPAANVITLGALHTTVAQRTGGNQGYSSIKLYDYMLDATEVLDLYNAEKDNFQPA